MEGDVIKSFLVGLGFGVDAASLKKFNDSIKSATLRVTALYASVQVAAAGIFKAISSVSSSFEQMGYEYRIIAPAINKALVLRNELLKAYRLAGIDIRKTIQASVRFNMSLAKTQFALKAIYTSVAAKFFPLLTKQMDVFRSKIYANMPKIQAALEKFISFIFKAFEATVILGNRVWQILERVYDFFYKLHNATDGWSTIILGVIAAWKLLNLSFLATPFGMLIAGIVALLALWDDFKTFREGGQSLINWGSDTTKTIIGLIGVIGALGAIVYTVMGAMKAWAALTTVFGLIADLIAVISGLNSVLTISEILMLALSAPVWVIVGAITALVAALTLADAKWNIFGGHLSGFFSGIGSKIMDFVGGNAGQNIQNNPMDSVGRNPIGSNIANSQTNQNVNQQTQINVMGSADANSVGRQVAGEQGRVNFDMVRNMKGSTR